MRETMSYWKKMAFGLALVAGLCGGAWAQRWGHNDAKAQNTQTWRGRVPQHERASVQNHTWGHSSPNYQYRNGGWAYRNNPNYQYRNGHRVYVPNRTWGTYYPNGNYGYYPNGNYGYYPNGNYGYYPSGNYGYYPSGTYYPDTQPWGYYPNGGYYPGTWGSGNGSYGYGGYNGEYQRGYRDGVAYGRSARGTGRGYHPGHEAAFKHGDQAYRQGFADGYNAGFYGRRW
ncbi:MAG TPA: hypothetical protein VMT05_06695 [Terriglobales bacterium]|nr:hypothetical protein [Terriglobales bacterium]